MSTAPTRSPELGFPKQPIVAPQWDPGVPGEFDGPDKFDEGDRATSGAILAVLLTMLTFAGVVSIFMAVDIAARPWGLPHILVDPMNLALGLLAFYFAIYAVPKWGSEWAQPVLPQSH